MTRSRGSVSAFPKTSTPNVAHNAIGYIGSTGGLTKREEFAARAMQGMLSSPHQFDYDRDRLILSRESVICADALLDALGEK